MASKIKPTPEVIEARRWLTAERRRKRLLTNPPPVAWPDHGIPPTHETLKKLRADVILRLVNQGKLSGSQATAAGEIHEVWSAFVCAAFPGRELQERVDQSGFTGDVFNRIPERLQYRWTHAYIPWSRAMSVPLGPGTRLELVLDIVVDNRGLRQTERKFKLWTHGAALRELRAALDAY